MLVTRPNVAVIYYSQTGTTYQLAQAIVRGAEEAGAEVRLRRVEETAPEENVQANEDWVAHREATRDVPVAQLDDLRWADALVFGTPTRYGLPTTQIKNLLDQSGPLWMNGELVDKVASSFTSTATAHGGHESTLLALNNTFYHWGCVVVPPGYADPVQFRSGTPYGTSFVSNNGALDPDETAREAARFQGARVVSVAQRLRAGERELAAT